MKHLGTLGIMGDSLRCGNTLELVGLMFLRPLTCPFYPSHSCMDVRGVAQFGPTVFGAVLRPAIPAEIERLEQGTTD